jgi:predicted enzyme related to lactoylglutathione lyase
MGRYVLRCSLPDRPGALGLVASRIGAVGGDIVSVAVRRRHGGRVEDEFLLDLPRDTPVELLVGEVAQVDEVRVLVCEPDRSGAGAGSRVVWFELLVDDVEAGAAYYRDALGWSSQPFGLVGGDYRLLSPGEGAEPIAGLVHSNAAVPTRTCAGPVPYVEVDGLDAVLARVEAAGGQIRVPPQPVDDSGRFAIVADRWGNRLGLWSPA